MNRLVLLIAAIVAVLIPASPAAAIVYGVPDGTEHPNVGGLVAVTRHSDGVAAAFTELAHAI